MSESVTKSVAQNENLRQKSMGMQWKNTLCAQGLTGVAFLTFPQHIQDVWGGMTSFEKKHDFTILSGDLYGHTGVVV